VAVLLLPLMRKLSREHQRCSDEARESARQSAALNGVVAE
jgi:POT family proton-dependent oligopeptide transporter